MSEKQHTPNQENVSVADRPTQLIDDSLAKLRGIGITAFSAGVFTTLFFQNLPSSEGSIGIGVLAGLSALAAKRTGRSLMESIRNYVNEKAQKGTR